MNPRLSAALFACVLFASPLRAEETEAETLFVMGREAMQRGDHATACRLFKQSLELDRAIGTLLNIARCEEELGHVASASKLYAEVMSGSEPTSERHAYAKKRSDALAARVPLLTLRLTSADTKLAISVDGKVVSESELAAPLALDPGKHLILVQREDGTAKSYELTLAESERRELELTPPPVAQPTPAMLPAPLATPAAQPPPGPPPGPAPVRAPPAAESARGSSDTLGWILLGAGAAGLVLTGISAVMVLDRKAVVERECNEDLVCRSQAGKDAADSGQTWSTIGTVAFIVGVAGTGAGSYLLLSAEPEQKSAFVGLGGAF